MRRRFIDEYPRLIGELRAALSKQDAVTARRAAHSLKGTADVFAAQSFVELAAHVESLAGENRLDEAAQCLAELDQAAEVLLQALATLAGAENNARD